MKPLSAKPDGFTLVELLVVISIITLLAGLTIAAMGGAQNSAARNRTKAEISSLSVAIESYKIDNGDYPRDPTSAAATDKLDATQSTSADALISSGKYMLSSVVLYQALSGDTSGNRSVGSTTDASGNTVKNKVYFPFKSGMLYPKGPMGSTTTVTALLDPFKNVYGYSTIYIATSGSSGYNPTFDLWSTADHDQLGATPTAAWITNW